MSGGGPEPLGATIVEGGVNFAVRSANAEAIEVCLFDAGGEREQRRVRLVERTGDVLHGVVGGLGAGARYGLRAYGRFAPRDGHRFNPAKLLLDPFATAIDRPFRYDPVLAGSRPDGGPDERDSAAVMPKAVVTDLPGGAAARPLTPWERTVIYELHVRGFTRLHPAIPPEIRGTFAGLAHPAALAHLTGLGVTTVEIMPAAAWIDERHLAAAGLSNYWGYNPVALLAPDPRLAPGGWAEVRSAVAALAAAGLETIVDVVLNHTGEGDEHGPTLSLRGLDNATFYRLRPDDRSRYVDDAGCGNTLALDRPAPLRLAMDALRAWAVLGGVHGFRFDLATTLGRRDGGFDPAAPLLAAIAQDPVLRELKLIAEPWDIGPGGYRIGAFPAAWGEWNDRFRDDVRRFWRGDGGMLGGVATRLAGSADVFAGKGRPSRGINYVAAHDGFTLADLVSHARKHNDANGEGGRDGTDANHSWNNGAEGAAADPAIAAARSGDQRALLALTLLARGTPMLAMGSESGHSQGGNNNAYAQDNATTWLDWAAADPALLSWTRRLIAIRRDQAAFRHDAFLDGAPAAGGIFPDVEWLRPDGLPLAAADWTALPEPGLAAVFCAPSAAGGARAAILVNRGTAPVRHFLPPAADARCWRLLAASARPDAASQAIPDGEIVVAARSVAVVAEEADDGTRPVRRSAAAPTLERLAAAAGIAAAWWEVDGTGHVVGDDTTRALLAAMRLPAGTESEARASLARLAEERDRRPLPFAAWQTEGHAGAVPVRLADGPVNRPLWLTVELEDGGKQHLRVSAEAGSGTLVAADGRALATRLASLPSLPAGRHTLRRDDAPDASCHLTVAPERCHVPTALAGDRRAFGVSAQLYALRRAGDQGIGDFTTLAELGAAAAAAGAAAVAINPLHARFPGQPDRASPYHPSDRRFLDPTYLDLAAIAGDLDLPATRAWLATEASALAGLSAGAAVDYPAVWAAKDAFLRIVHAAFEALARDRPDHPAASAFATFVATRGATLAGYAAFEAIAAARPGIPWQSWEPDLRAADGTAVGAFAAAHGGEVRYRQFLQFLCDRQLGAAAAATGLGLGIVGDLAVGAAPDGAEAWAGQAGLMPAVSIGAPPDPIAPRGQVWSLPPPDPLAMARDGFAGFATLLAANMRHAGGLRIDHVMGLTRLFLVPDGADGRDGAYVAYPFDHLLAEVKLASRRAGCLVIGEDLGTVPDGLRPALAEAGVLAYRVLLLERDGVDFRPPASVPASALASATTHDLPTLAGWWSGEDIVEEMEIGLIDAAEAAERHERRSEERAALMAALGRADLATQSPAAPIGPEVLAAIHALVARSPARLALAQADDLGGEVRSVNLPGTDRERPNWRRRIARPLPELLEGDAARAILAALRAERPPASR